MKILITEANLTNFSELLAAINKVVEDKGVTQFTGSEPNKVKSWFLKKYFQAIKDDEIDLRSSIKRHQYKNDEPEWMNKPDIMDFSGTLPNEVVDEINHIIDYFATLEENDLRKIDREPYSAIKKKVEEWDREMAANVGNDADEDAKKKTLKEGTDWKVMLPLPSGMKLVKLVTPESKDVEGDVMGHCVGGDRYDAEDIYSIWDSKNRSHVTLQANDRNKTIKQIKGKGNAAPVEKYMPATIESVCEFILKGYKVEGDGENIGMIQYEDEYHFDDLNSIPEKYRNKSVFRTWVDKIFPTVIFPKQQKAFADIRARIVEV